MTHSTNSERLDMTADEWRGLTLILTNRLKGFTPSRVIVSKRAGERVYTVAAVGPRSMPKHKIFHIYPNGDVKRSDQ